MTGTRRKGRHLIPPTEAEFQSAVIQLAQTLGWWVYHTHDSRRSQAGFPDLVLLRERVVWAELKSVAGRLTTEQEAWLQALRKAGQEAYTWRPGDEQEIADTLALRAAGR